MAVLPAEQRVRRSEDFAATVRRGRRVGSSGLVLYVWSDTQSTRTSLVSARAGFIVGRAVGSAVVRNRVRRQLQHLMAAHLVALPTGTDVVVRVTPSAVKATSRELGETLAGLLKRALPAGPTPAPSPRPSLRSASC